MPSPASTPARQRTATAWTSRGLVPESLLVLTGSQGQALQVLPHTYRPVHAIVFVETQFTASASSMWHAFTVHVLQLSCWSLNAAQPVRRNWSCPVLQRLWQCVQVLVGCRGGSVSLHELEEHGAAWMPDSTQSAFQLVCCRANLPDDRSHPLLSNHQGQSI